MASLTQHRGASVIDTLAAYDFIGEVIYRLGENFVSLERHRGWWTVIIQCDGSRHRIRSLTPLGALKIACVELDDLRDQRGPIVGLRAF